MSTISPTEIVHLQNLRNRISEIECNGIGHSDGANDMIQRVLCDFREKARRIEAAWPNNRLLAHYRVMANESLSAELDDLLREIQYRNLAI